MLTLQIDNRDIEEIFTEGFRANKEKFLAFIKQSYAQRESLRAYESDKERFVRIYTRMKQGSMEMLTEPEADREVERFLETL